MELLFRIEVRLKASLSGIYRRCFLIQKSNDHYSHNVERKCSALKLHSPSQVINEMLTQLAKRRLDAVNAETCEAQFKLESSPSTTAELAEYLTFLDEIQERVRRRRWMVF